MVGTHRNLWGVVERFEQSNIGEVLWPAGGALHLEQILAVGDGDRQIAQGDVAAIGFSEYIPSADRFTSAGRIDTADYAAQAPWPA